MRLLLSTVAWMSLAIALLAGGGRSCDEPTPRSARMPAVWAMEKLPPGVGASRFADGERACREPLVVSVETEEREEERRVEERRESDEPYVPPSLVMHDGLSSLPVADTSPRFQRMRVTGPHTVHLDRATPPPKA